MVTKGLFSVAQQLFSHLFSRIITRYIAKFEHLGATILLTSNWLVTVARTISFCLSMLDLTAELFLLHMTFLGWGVPADPSD